VWLQGKGTGGELIGWVGRRSSKDVDVKKQKKTTRSADALTTLDNFLKEEGKREEFEAAAVKEELAWQIAEAMKAQNPSRKRLAEHSACLPNTSK
jgi:TPP-dependent pyruvate/acetoin dehydrogenase alpha subunit